MHVTPSLPPLKRVPPGAWVALAWCASTLFTVLARIRLPGQNGPNEVAAAQFYRWDGLLFFTVACVLALAGSAWLGRRPLAALTLLLAAGALFTTNLAVTAIQLAQYLAVDVALYFIAAGRSRRTGTTGLAMALAVLAAWLTGRLVQGWGIGTLVELTVALTVVVAWLLGDASRRTRVHAEQLRARAAGQAVTDERLRIAREMHDMVAHSIGIIALQAGAAARVAHTQPDAAREAMTAVETAGRETLAGLRRMLVALREADHGDGRDLLPGTSPDGHSGSSGDTGGHSGSSGGIGGHSGSSGDPRGHSGSSGDPGGHRGSSGDIGGHSGSSGDPRGHSGPSGDPGGHPGSSGVPGGHSGPSGDPGGRISGTIHGADGSDGPHGPQGPGGDGESAPPGPSGGSGFGSGPGESDLPGAAAGDRFGTVQSAATRPAEGLADLERLAAAATAAGVRVDLRWTGERRQLPADVDLSAFRIVQESVTNVLRHAATTVCRVTVDHRDTEVAVEITDDGRGRGSTTDTGFGLIGMRERAALLHGEFTAGPRPEGGFRVSARLPLPATGRAGAR
ncbi:histidine kinase [Streptomyces sp. NPDC059618]|uniref:histidine kinase n=1 Tax=Streptomyces sp. NPDC059618 TaxID=3346887 RepID=UPI0036A31868